MTENNVDTLSKCFDIISFKTTNKNLYLFIIVYMSLVKKLLKVEKKQYFKFLLFTLKSLIQKSNLENLIKFGSSSNYVKWYFFLLQKKQCLQLNC